VKLGYGNLRKIEDFRQRLKLRVRGLVLEVPPAKRKRRKLALADSFFVLAQRDNISHLLLKCNGKRKALYFGALLRIP